MSEIARNAFRYARRRAGRVRASRAGQRRSSWWCASATAGPGIADLARDPRRPVPVRDRHGPRHRRRAPADGPVRDRHPRPGAARRVVLRQAPAPRRGRSSTPGRPRRAIAEELARERAAATRSRRCSSRTRSCSRARRAARAARRSSTRLNRELEDTNRGVVALYAELDEKADHLRRADEMKSRFLSNMSHEFRTPLNSILALSRLLLERTDGELTAEQEQAGRASSARRPRTSPSWSTTCSTWPRSRPARSSCARRSSRSRTCSARCAACCGRCWSNESVQPRLRGADGLPHARHRRGKVSQILRNFISNALKFTERGEVRVSAALPATRTTVVFAVADTGIGIAPEDQERIFEEFTQVESPLQRRVQGHRPRPAALPEAGRAARRPRVGGERSPASARPSR